MTTARRREGDLSHGAVAKWTVGPARRGGEGWARRYCRAYLVRGALTRHSRMGVRDPPLKPPRASPPLRDAAALAVGLPKRSACPKGKGPECSPGPGVRLKRQCYRRRSKILKSLSLGLADVVEEGVCGGILRSLWKWWSSKAVNSASSLKRKTSMK